MSTPNYDDRRSQLEEYFDRTAFEAWRRMTSDAPLSRVRSSVRAGRDMMRQELLSLLPGDLHGQRVLDAGCGTGMLSIEIAQRGAEVIGVDLSPNLIAIARGRTELEVRGTVAYLSGDMLNDKLGKFDHVVAMDSLIHYDAESVIAALSKLATRTQRSIAFTFVPKTLALSMMHSAGKLFPRADRAPRIEPVREDRLRSLIDAAPGLKDWTIIGGERVSHGFYTSQSLLLLRKPKPV